MRQFSVRDSSIVSAPDSAFCNWVEGTETIDTRQLCLVSMTETRAVHN